jgi:hypothetical protein
MNPRYLSGLLAFLAGALLNYLGDRLLGVKLELFWGLSTFSFAWVLDVFFLPFLVGLLVAWIFGKGAKWLSYFPPLLVRCISYAEIFYISGTPHGANLNPMGWWGFYVILAMESAGIGGILGEVLIKNVYGRTTGIITATNEESISEDTVAKKES